MKIRDLVDEDLNHDMFYQLQTTSPEFDGTPLSKTFRSPDCEHALVPPLTRTAQVISTKKT